MPKYISNPTSVDAWAITKVGPKDSSRGRRLEFLGRDPFYAHGAMLARIDVQPGDYLVRTEDGYLYLNPRAVFEKKCHARCEWCDAGNERTVSSLSPDGETFVHLFTPQGRKKCAVPGQIPTKSAREIPRLRLKAIYDSYPRDGESAVADLANLLEEIADLLGENCKPISVVQTEKEKS